MNRFMMTTLVVLFATTPAGRLSGAERSNDRQVTALVDSIDRGFDAWKDSLSQRNLDDAVLRDATGTVEVRRFLDDFERDIDRVKDRLKDDYSAGPEVTELLRRGSDVQRRAQSGAQPAWAALATQLRALASAYGTEFPLPTTDATAARLTDNELAAHLQTIEQQAKRVSSEADAAMKKAKVQSPERAQMKQAFGALGSAAKQSRGRAKDGTLTRVQAEGVLDAASAARTRVASLALRPQGQTAWSSIERSSSALARAFGMTW